MLFMKEWHTTWWGTSILTVLSGLLVSYFGFGIGKSVPATSLDVNNSPSSINTIGQVGNNTIVGKSARFLSKDQKVILKNAFSRTTERVVFMSKIFDAEAKAYAEQLSEPFVSAGWDVEAPIRQDLLDDFDGKINIFKTGKNVSTDISVSLFEKIPAFDQAGILYESKIPRKGSFGGNLEEDTLYIEVGSN